MLTWVHAGCAQVLWRYTVLYMTERCYESGGRVWDQVFNNVCWCLFICIFFTGSLPASLALLWTCRDTADSVTAGA